VTAEAGTEPAEVAAAPLSLRQGLLARYPRPGWALFFEVPSAKGFADGSTRYADAIAVGLWPSLGLEIVGFELKTSRADWLGELKQPEKANRIMSYCHRWWLVAGGPDVFEKEELPATWGALQWRGNRFKVAKKAPALQPKSPPMGFICSLIARSQEGMLHREEIQKEIDQAKADGRRDDSWERRSLEREVAGLKERLSHFKKETGIDLTYEWNFDSTISAIRLVQKHQASTVEEAIENLDLITGLERLRSAAESIVATCKEVAGRPSALRWNALTPDEREETQGE